MSDYVKASVLGAPTAPNAEGKLEAAAASAPAADAANGQTTTSAERRLIWRLNDFPYYYEPGVEHHLLWCTEPLDVAEVDRLARERFGGGSGGQQKKRQHLIFVNPAQLQSVLAVWHAHVLVRDAPDADDEADHRV